MIPCSVGDSGFGWRGRGSWGGRGGGSVVVDRVVVGCSPVRGGLSLVVGHLVVVLGVRTENSAAADTAVCNKSRADMGLWLGSVNLTAGFRITQPIVNSY